MAISTINESKKSGGDKKNNNKPPVDGSGSTAQVANSSTNKVEPESSAPAAGPTKDARQVSASPQKQGNQPQNRGNQNPKGNERPTRPATQAVVISPQRMGEISNLAGQVKNLKWEEQSYLWKKIGISPIQADAYNPSERRVERVNVVVDEDLLATFGIFFRMLHSICELRKMVGQGTRLAATPSLAKLLREAQVFFDEEGKPTLPALFQPLIEEIAYVAAITKAVERESLFFKSNAYQRKKRNDLMNYEPVPDALKSEDYQPRLEFELKDLRRRKKEGRLPPILRPLYDVLVNRFGKGEQQEQSSGESASASSGIATSAEDAEESKPVTTGYDGEPPSSVSGESVVEAGAGY